MPLRDLAVQPRVYDAVQTLAGARRVQKELRPYVNSFAGTRVLDVGAGTGRYVTVVPDPADYVAVDLDPDKLRRLRATHPGIRTIVADACSLDFERASFDNALCTFLLHHLSESESRQLTSVLRRILRTSLVVIDPLRDERRLRSRVLWSIDRGAHPRNAAELLAVLEPDFVVEHMHEFEIHHRYLLCVASPRGNAATISGALL